MCTEIVKRFFLLLDPPSIDPEGNMHIKIGVANKQKGRIVEAISGGCLFEKGAIIYPSLEFLTKIGLSHQGLTDTNHATCVLTFVILHITDNGGKIKNHH